MSSEFPPANPKADKAARKAYDKANRPFYKKKRVIIPAALLAIIGFSAASGGGGSDTVTTDNASDTATEAPDTSETKAPAASKAPAKAAAKPAAKPAEPAIVVSAKELIAVLEGNALKAKNTYDGKQVTVSGFVGSIDASGDYFSLDPEPEALVFTGVQVNTSEKFQDQVANFSKGQAITVTGKIDDVGEIMGYSLKAETIK